MYDRIDWLKMQIERVEQFVVHAQERQKQHPDKISIKITLASWEEHLAELKAELEKEEKK